MKEIKEWIKSFLLALALVLPVSYFASPAIVEGSSMQPTLYDNNVVIMEKNINHLDHGDVVVFDARPMDDKYYIKRIIGMPGDEVEIVNGSVYVNGKQLEETYLDGATITEPEMKVIVPDGEVFVLGDNREVSEDSRFIGTISLDKIKGEAYFRIFPFNRTTKL